MPIFGSRFIEFLRPFYRSQNLTLNAIVALTRILGKKNTATRSTAMVKGTNYLVMDGSNDGDGFIIEIVEETSEIGRKLVNASGEATLMLFQTVSSSDTSFPADSKWTDAHIIAVNLWSNLIHELNRKMLVDDVVLAFANIHELAYALFNNVRTRVVL